MFEKLLEAISSSSDKKSQEMCLETNQMFEESKRDKADSDKLLEVLKLLGTAREQCKESNLKDTIQQAGDLIANILENILIRIKERESRTKEIEQKVGKI